MDFARSVRFQIKSGMNEDFNRLFTTDVLPVLKKQKGFKQYLSLVNPKRAMGISVWEDRASAETYQNTLYPQLLEKLTPFLEGPPRVDTYKVTTGAPTS